MLFSYNWLQLFFRKKLPQPKKLAELLTMHSFEVEEVKKAGSDWALNIDVLPNRGPDCFSHLGIAREISVITKQKYTGLTCAIREVKNKKIKDFLKVEVKNKNDCSRYTARVITNIKVGPSPQWIQQRLKVCGLRPINNIVDIMNYVMLETGQPIHAFDGEKLKGEKIIVRFAKNREKIVTLDEEKYDLSEDILIIADTQKPIAIAGIKGGIISGIDRKTKVIVLESANFNPRIIRKGSRKLNSRAQRSGEKSTACSLNLKTDASIRFEHGIDPNLTKMAINRAAYLIQKIVRGKITKGLIDIYPKKVLPKKIRLDLDYVDRLLGAQVSEKKIRDILRNMGFEVKSTSQNSKALEVKIPTRRLDVSIQEDLIEEIGRIYGYQEIPAQFPVASLIPPKRNLDIFWEDMIKNILKETGFSEVYNYSFWGEKEVKLFGYLKTKELIEVENPVSLEYKYLRASLIPNLLKNVEKNLKHFDQIKIFELGKIFEKPKQEKTMLTGLITGDLFYLAKGVVDLLLNKLGISNIWYDEFQPTPATSEDTCLILKGREDSKLNVHYWHPQKRANIKVNGQEIGFLGEISAKILDEMKIKTKVVIFDIDFEKLQRLSSEEVIYRPISRYPAAVRDIAILVSKQTKVVEILNIIKITGGKIVRDVDLFDTYEGENIPVGKKNFAFHIIYQAEDKTLSSKEIDRLHQKIIKALEKNTKGWKVRR